MKAKSSLKFVGYFLMIVLVCFKPSVAEAVDSIVMGIISRSVEQLPTYAASDKGFFAQEGIKADIVLIGSTDTLVQALVAGQ